jgi:hypothetical protein
MTIPTDPAHGDVFRTDPDDGEPDVPWLRFPPDYPTYAGGGEWFTSKELAELGDVVPDDETPTGQTATA